jgi:hypothetical protein
MQIIQQHRFCRWLWMGLILFSSTLLQAQNEPYRGGAGYGDIHATATLTACNNFRFAGGFGRGDSSFAMTALNNNIFRFSGGFGRGDSSFAMAELNNNIFRFEGGVGKGDSSSKTNLLNCNGFRFYGDSADGSAMAAFIKLRNYLGDDTSIQIICSSERIDLLPLYDSTDLDFTWNTADPTAVGLGNFRLIATTQSGCKDTAYANIFQEVAVWKGTISKNWHNAANWRDGKIPGDSTHVIIPGGTSFSCEISQADAVAASVQGRVSAGFNIINNRHLRISANCSSLPTGL